MNYKTLIVHHALPRHMTILLSVFMIFKLRNLLSSPYSRLVALPCLLIGLSGLWACSESTPVAAPEFGLIDTDASYATRSLYQNLNRLSPDHVLFGHQDALAYGVLWEGDEDRSDIRDVAGSHPALYGWEIGNLELGAAENLDKVNFVRMQEWIRAAFERGGVITISWHMNSPVTGGNAWDTRPTVAQILPGGSHHKVLVDYLDAFIEFNKDLIYFNRKGKERHIPIIFRPWHEHNGDWFWWGKGSTSEADYIALWRFTVDYLRAQGVHNLIYAFSPDRSRIDLENFTRDYFYGYPGDDYVDVIGLDNYWDLGHPANNTPAEQQKLDFAQSLQNIVQIAHRKNKIAALTEGGQDKLGNPRFWTEVMLPAIESNADTRGLAYIMMWRNANREREGRDHFYVPYQGFEHAADFIDLVRSPLVLLEQELPNMYVRPRPVK